MALKGIDVSRWQGNIDWKKVKSSGIEFAMIRGGYGDNHVDSRFYENAKEQCSRDSYGNLLVFLCAESGNGATGSQVCGGSCKTVSGFVACCL